MPDRRRQNVNRRAYLILENSQRIPCRIANVSRGGALVLVETPIWLPRTFIVRDVFEGSERPVEIMWTGSDRAGVRFLDAGPVKSKKGFGKRGD